MNSYDELIITPNSTKALLDDAIRKCDDIEARIYELDMYDLVIEDENIERLVAEHANAITHQVMINAAVESAQIEVDRIKRSIERLLKRREWAKMDNDIYDNITAKIESVEVNELIPAEEHVKKLKAKFVSESTVHLNLSREIVIAERREQDMMDEITRLVQNRSVIYRRIEQLERQYERELEIEIV